MIVLDRTSQIGENGSRREKARLEKAIVRLANAKDLGDMRALVNAFPDLMPPSADKIDWTAKFNQQPKSASEALKRIGRAQLKLRAAWKVPHGVFRRILLIELAGADIVRALDHPLDTFHSVVGAPPERISTGELIFPPALLPRHEAKLRGLEPALLSRQRFFFLLAAALDAAPKMRMCHNPECPHPFYLRSEGGKKFCSKACATPSQRAHKLKWWNQHKKELLAIRRAEYRKRSRRASRRIKSQRREKRK